MGQLKVARWGNSLAIRLPKGLAEELGLREGDFVERDALALRRSLPKMSKDEVKDAIRQLRRELPSDWKVATGDRDQRG